MISKSLLSTPRARETRPLRTALRAAALLAACFAVGGVRTVGAQEQRQQSATNERGQAQSAAAPCHQQPPAAGAATGGGGVAASAPIPDVWVTDQDGNRRRFYSDLLKGKTVAVNFVFTSCTYICPMQGKNFSELQATLGERLGRDVHLVSVSTDPATDTPERLKAWAAKYGARPGWTLVTGATEEMDKLLLALTGDTSGQSKHSPVAFVGDIDKGLWVRAYALAEPERYLRTFAEAAARPPASRPEPNNSKGGVPAAPPRQ